MERGSSPLTTRCPSVARLLDQHRPHRKLRTRQFVATLQDALCSAGITAAVTSRIKSPCSARDKMVRLGLGLPELQDVCGIRVVVDDVPTCYAVLALVHRLWPHVPEAFDDYIATPKSNGYQSLHTVVRLACGHPLELQIRTREQHRAAEAGSAAHWRYKATASQPGSQHGPDRPPSRPDKPPPPPRDNRAPGCPRD